MLKLGGIFANETIQTLVTLYTKIQLIHTG